MNDLIKNIQPGCDIGVIYEGFMQKKPRIEKVKSLSPKGYVTLETGERFTPNGYRIGDRELADGRYTRLCSVEQAQEVIAQNEFKQQEKEERLRQWKESPEGKREDAVRSAVAAAIKVLNERGWYHDIDGKYDVMEKRIEYEIKQFVEAVEPVELEN